MKGAQDVAIYASTEVADSEHRPPPLRDAAWVGDAETTSVVVAVGLVDQSNVQRALRDHSAIKIVAERKAAA